MKEQLPMIESQIEFSFNSKSMDSEQVSECSNNNMDILNKQLDVEAPMSQSRALES
jgi:hypothetical protein